MKTKIFFIIIAFTSFCNAQIINIPDANFKSKLLSSNTTNNLVAKNLSGNYFKIDSNNDGQIQVSEALQVSWLNISSSNITDLTGLNHFSNLLTLDCQINVIPVMNLSSLTNLQSLTCVNCSVNSINLQGLSNLNFLNCGANNLSSLNLSGLINLQSLFCGNNPITSLNLNGLTNLQTLSFELCQISNINLSGLINLQSLYCGSNLLTNLDVSVVPNLNYLACDLNQISSLNLNGLTNLTFLGCSQNQLSTLNLSGLGNIQSLYCYSNQLTTLDISQLTNIIYLKCQNNLLESLYIKNGVNEASGNINFSNNPNLHYICADEVQLTSIENKISTYGYNNCFVNTYCSFTPGGSFYLVQGTSKYDNDNNGCDINDFAISNLKFSIVNGSSNGYIISNNNGNYSIPLSAGTYNITPIIENPSYFNMNPNNFNVSFPISASPYNQNFCVSANGIHNDLEINIIPITGARPGFDSNYKIIYKNKGTTTQSGTINFTFDDSVLDFVSSNPNVSSQSTGSLNWNFTNLLPFESREINILLNLNSPTETPALNSGDLLNYTASVNGQLDETPNDNIAILNQIVVNSYDPNDKTCLEGTTITPSMVGEYVHYLIRFENNGTANAQNIVVKDIIDTNKFDSNSLIPIKGSHNFETRILSTNKVEFIFQNINLPFDDANNDGYVSFKIKTKPNLVVGNTFSNSANIYFDYNFPIVTNNYTTTIQNTLDLQENYFINDIVAYPNPVKDFLSFKTENKIFKIEVYDIAGRILSSNLISENKIDLSELKTGNYILKLYTEKGIMNTKIMKE